MKTRETKTKYAVLGMLTFGAKSGYEISKAIQNSTAFFWSESDGQLYPILKQLTEENLVTATEENELGKRNKKVYEITDEGQEALVAWLHQDPTTFTIRNEFLLQLFFGHNIKDQYNIEKIKSFQHALKNQLKLFDSIEERIKEKNIQPTYKLLSLSYGQHALQAEITWCEKAIKVLEGKS